MSAPAKDKEELEKQGLDFQALDRTYKQDSKLTIRKALSLALFISAGSVWLLALSRFGSCQQALPWFLTIGTLSLVSLGFLRVEKPAIKLPGLPRHNEPLKLKESLSICFFAAAISLYAQIAYLLLHPAKSELKKLSQVIDIQLVSELDFKNNNAILPGTKTEDELRKRSADKLSQKGALIPKPQVQPFQTNQNSKPEKISQKTESKINQKDETTEESKKQKTQFAALAATPQEKPALPLMVPNTWQTKVIDKELVQTRPKQINQGQSKNQPYIMEVEPPELVELIENDGRLDAQSVFQRGGKSSGGKGAENALSIYLKDLHRRIKNAWSPPRGNTRNVIVLFRLKKDGHLAFLKIERSSGEKTTDESAQKAIITAATNGKALPNDYTPEFLDVAYTFNYNVNELENLNDKQSILQLQE